MTKYLSLALVLSLFGAVAAQADTAANFKAECLRCHHVSNSGSNEGFMFPVSVKSKDDTSTDTFPASDVNTPFTAKEKADLFKFLNAIRNPSFAFGSTNHKFIETVDVFVNGGSGSHFSPNTHEAQIKAFLDALALSDGTEQGFDAAVATGDATAQ